MKSTCDKILETYATESEEHLSKMEEALIGLEADPGNDNLLEAIFRGAHTIKGNSASLGFPKLAGFAHAFEDILQRLRSRVVPVNRSRVTLLLRAVDAMRELVPQAIAGRDELAPGQITLLDELTNGGSAEATPTTNSGNEKVVLRRSEEMQTWSEKTGTVRVDTTKLDRMLNLAGEIAIGHGRLRQALRPRRACGEDVWEAHEQVERLPLWGCKKRS
jgi:chemotaxis protein histidine kinase CheA